MQNRAVPFVSLVLAIGLAPLSPLPGSPAEDGRPPSIPTFSDTGVQEDQAVDALQLHILDGKSYDLGSAWRDRPALLVLSSISCPVSRDNCPAVDRIAITYAGKINVVVIYTLEAHPVGAVSPYSDREWLTDRNVRDHVLVKQPADLAQRIAVAKQYRELKQIRATLVVDDIDNRAWNHIGPGPNSAILVGTRGDVLFRQGWLDAAGMEAAIRWTLLKIRDELLRHQAAALSPKLGLNVVDELRRFDLKERRDEIELILHEQPKLVNLMVGLGRGDHRGDTPLHGAADYGNEEEVTYLLRHAPDLDQINVNGRTPLHLAADRGAAEVVKSLLAHGADPNAFDDQGLTPIHLALLAGKRDVVTQLIGAGGAMDIRLAAGLGDDGSLKRYLDIYRQTDIYLKIRGGAALSFAAANNQTAAMTKLMDEGVSVTVDVNGHPPFYYAVHNRQHNAVALLLDRKVNSDISMDYYLGGPLHFAAGANDGAFITMLVADGADVEKLNLDERTPLHEAAQWGGVEAVQALLDAGAHINARTGCEEPRPCGVTEAYGRPLLETPLHLAVTQTNVEVVSLLLKFHAATDLKDRNRETPLDVALRLQQSRPSAEAAKIVELLNDAS